MIYKVDFLDDIFTLSICRKKLRPEIIKFYRLKIMVLCSFELKMFMQKSTCNFGGKSMFNM